MADIKNNDIIIAHAMLDHLNRWPDKPCEINLEELDKAPATFSMSMQQLSGTVVLRKYVDGSFIGQWPFAVYVRISGSDTAKKLEAQKILEQIGDWMSEAELPDIGAGRVPEEIDMEGLPYIAAAYEDGSIDYQAVFRLGYKAKGR